jgi:DeoR/GlpR family transcriptional regulator of sugar metabolism
MQQKSLLPVNKRQQDIIDYARENGFVTVENLSEKFQVTHQTIFS